MTKFQNIRKQILNNGLILIRYKMNESKEYWITSLILLFIILLLIGVTYQDLFSIR